MCVSMEIWVILHASARVYRFACILYMSVHSKKCSVKSTLGEYSVTKYNLENVALTPVFFTVYD